MKTKRSAHEAERKMFLRSIRARACLWIWILIRCRLKIKEPSKGSRRNFILYICFLPEVASRELFLCGGLSAAGTKVLSENEVRGWLPKNPYRRNKTRDIQSWTHTSEVFKESFQNLMTMAKDKSNYSRKNVSSRTLGRIVSLPLASCLAYLKEG
jgi:hypothetical protein